MSWTFETDPEFQTQLDWVERFVRDEVMPLDHVLKSPYDIRNPANDRLVRPLQDKVKARNLWACHLGPELGGLGYGQVKLALLNEILGQALFAPMVFGCAAPDTGNAEILAHFGTAEQKQRYLEPLLDNHIVSSFMMTEPQGGADPRVIRTRAVADGDGWVLNGEKWFATNARWADFFIVMAVTDPEAPPYKTMSMLLVPADTPGVEIVRNTRLAGETVGTEGYVRFSDARVSASNMLGNRGEAFKVAQVRLGGGRIHHAMRTVGEARKALELMCRRALSRVTQGDLLASKQMIQERIADSWIELEQFRLLVLRTAWLIDRHQDYKIVRKDISAVKAAMSKVLHDIAARALQIHGSIGISDEMPFMAMIRDSFVMALADGPTEVHKIVLAREILADFEPDEDLFPDYHLVCRREAAERRFAPELGALAADAF